MNTPTGKKAKARAKAELATKKVAGKAAKAAKKAKQAKTPVATDAKIVKTGRELQLVRIDGNRMLASRVNRPGVVDKLLARAKHYGVTVTNEKTARDKLATQVAPVEAAAA